MVRVFLTLTGLLYIGLGIWCAVDPAATSRKVGLQRQPGSGESEFLTVYGGLELGLGLMFLLPLVMPAWERGALAACVLIHAAVVAFRTAGFFLFTGIGPFTVRLAVAEWIILLVAAGVWWASSTVEGLAKG